MIVEELRLALAAKPAEQPRPPRRTRAKPVVATEPAPEPGSTYLTMAQVIARTGLSPSFAYELAWRGDIRVRAMGKGGRGLRVLLADLIAWETTRVKGGIDAQVKAELPNPKNVASGVGIRHTAKLRKP